MFRALPTPPQTFKKCRNVIALGAKWWLLKKTLKAIFAQ